MRTMAKVTIRNATRQDLIDFIANITQDIPHDNLTTAQLVKKVRECEKRSFKWFGGHVSFEDWANS